MTQILAFSIEPFIADYDNTEKKWMIHPSTLGLSDEQLEVILWNLAASP